MPGFTNDARPIVPTNIHHMWLSLVFGVTLLVFGVILCAFHVTLVFGSTMFATLFDPLNAFPEVVYVESLHSSNARI